MDQEEGITQYDKIEKTRGDSTYRKRLQSNANAVPMWAMNSQIFGYLPHEAHTNMRTTRNTPFTKRMQSMRIPSNKLAAFLCDARKCSGCSVITES